MTANQFYRALQEYLQKEDNGLKQNMKDKLARLQEKDIEIGQYPWIDCYEYDYECRAIGQKFGDDIRFPLTVNYTSNAVWYYTGDEMAVIKDIDHDFSECGGYKGFTEDKYIVGLYQPGDTDSALKVDAALKLHNEFHKYNAYLYTLVPIEINDYTERELSSKAASFAPVIGKLCKEDGTVETIRLGYIHNDNGGDYLNNVTEEKIVFDFTQDKQTKEKSSGVPAWVWIVGGVGLFVFPPVGIGFLIYGIIKALISK